MCQVRFPKVPGAFGHFLVQNSAKFGLLASRQLALSIETGEFMSSHEKYVITATQILAAIGTHPTTVRVTDLQMVDRPFPEPHRD
jgi:hypothetical protein